MNVKQNENQVFIDLQMEKLITTKRKRPRHPIYIQVGKVMAQKYDYSECTFPSDSETLVEAQLCIRRQRKKWMSTRIKKVKSSILSCLLPNSTITTSPKVATETSTSTTNKHLFVSPKKIFCLMTLHILTE